MSARTVVLLSLLGGLLLGAPASAAGGRPEARAYELYARGDYPAAAAQLMPLAWRGKARAQALLGFLYETGKGVPQNNVAAAAWYICAAEQGESTAQYFLGLLYDKGHGVPLDVVLSQKWLSLAAARASKGERSLYSRVRSAVASKMSVAQLALAQRLALEWTPAAPAFAASWPPAAPTGGPVPVEEACPIASWPGVGVR